MSDPRINGLRSIELGVHDLQKSAEFYRKVWALEDVAAEGDAHPPARHRPRPPRRDAARAAAGGAPRRAFLGARPRHRRCAARPGQGDGRQGRCRAAALPASGGGGYGFRVSTPEGHPLCDLVGRRAARRGDRRPLAADQAHPRGAQQRRSATKQTAFFLDVLGFKWSDSTFMMDFVRCCSDHHSVAFARGNGPVAQPHGL